jgi:hypothetical protein
VENCLFEVGCIVERNIMDLCMAVHFLFDISAAFLCEEDKYEV